MAWSCLKIINLRERALRAGFEEVRAQAAAGTSKHIILHTCNLVTPPHSKFLQKVGLLVSILGPVKGNFVLREGSIDLALGASVQSDADHS